MDFAAPLTLIITAVTAIISYQAFNNYSLFQKLLFNPWSVKNRNEYYRVLSHTLVHSDFTHLAFNMITFFSFGSFLEQYFYALWGQQKGMILFLVLYIGGTIVASLPALRKHSDNSSYNAVGASGAVSAIMMAFMIMFPMAQLRFFFLIPMPAYIGALVFFAMEHFLQKKGGTNIAHDAHIYGAMAGIIFTMVVDFDYLIMFFQQIRNSWFG
ncbi:MAG: rhomboid family intramembrane serine protease [Flavobacteriales bacterium]